jgi:ribA/ribD-fused uncharacterized protein
LLKERPVRAIFFYKRDRLHFGWLGNYFEKDPFLFRSCLETNDSRTTELIRDWRSVEHFYQAAKSTNFERQERIRKSARAVDASLIGLRVSPLREEWDNVKQGFMERAISMKFDQNPALASRLIATDPDNLICDDSRNCTWGIGRMKCGHNLLGIILMNKRSAMLNTVAYGR